MNGYSWYGKHIPVYVSLAEAARSFSENEDFLEIAFTLCARRGLPISLPLLRECASLGQVAFFFDGLDEVVSIEQRAALVNAIDRLLTDLEPLGNRFVLTSRPAAVQLLSVPDRLTILYLRGLTEEEMRTLATRVLAARLSEHGDAVRLDTARLKDGDHAVVDRLIADVHAVQGIRRLATNPLLLTLLIMIYVNSGSPSAKRHRVYHQAVQTLVSVRSRASGQTPLSEADLRARLGAVALSVFRDPEGAVPTRTAVHARIKEVMVASNPDTSDDDVSSFIQSVADSTGLLVLHDGRDGSPDASTVTFMHYSFLEYYAAQGLKSLLPSEVAELATHPRWREVVTILAGLLSDEGDLSPLIEALLVPKSETDEITLEATLFALDCTLESEVPPDRARRAVFRALDESLRSGAAKHDKDLQREIGQRLARFGATSSSDPVATLLRAGLADHEGGIAAAFIEVLSRVALDHEVAQSLLGGLTECCSRDETEIQVAICEAIGRAAVLRFDATESVVDKAIRGNLSTKLAAVRAIESAPALAASRWPTLVACLRDERPFIAVAAARGLVGAGLRVDAGDPADRRLLLDVLRTLQQDAEAMKLTTMSVTKRALEAGLMSRTQEERLIAIRMLPWLRGEEQYVHDALLAALRRGGSDFREERVAALQALPVATGAHRLMRVAEVDDLRNFLVAETRDVRVAACRALAVIGASPNTVAQVGSDMVRYISEHSYGEEFRWGVRALAGCADGWPEGRERLFMEISNRVSKGDAYPSSPPSRSSTPPANDLAEVLRACQALDGGAAEHTSTRLITLVRDYKADIEVRQEACKTLASVAVPSYRTARFFVEELLSLNVRLGDSLAEAVRRFIERCRKSVEYVRAVSGSLSEMERGVILNYRRAKEAGSRGDLRIGELRRALEEIQHTMRAYREFAQISTA